MTTARNSDKQPGFEPLRDAVATRDGDGFTRGVHHLNEDFILWPVVILIDNAEAVWTDQSFLSWQRRARHDEQRVSFRHRDDDIAGDKPDGAGLDGRVFPCNEVKSRSAVRFVLRQWQRFINTFYGHLHASIVP